MNKPVATDMSQRDLGVIVNGKFSWYKKLRSTGEAMKALFQIKRNLP